MWNSYLAANIAHPLFAAALQFAILGTLGELLSIRVRTGARKLPWGWQALGLKILGWAFLGIYIKFMFVTASSGIGGLATYLNWPTLADGPLLLKALATSVLMNVMLGPSMILVHRLYDNGVARWTGERSPGWAGIDKALGTLVWLWIPLHTFTFTQAPATRIGIAALLSLVLGIVLGLAARSRN